MLNHLEFRIEELNHRVEVYHNEDIHQSSELIKQLNDEPMHEQLSMIEHKQMEWLNRQLSDESFFHRSRQNNER